MGAGQIDIHEGLENTLVILRSKIREGILVHRDYAEDLPRINAYGSEVNQVWTNIIDNAIYAMDGQGEMFLKTYQENSWVLVETRSLTLSLPPSRQGMEPVWGFISVTISLSKSIRARSQ